MFNGTLQITICLISIFLILHSHAEEASKSSPASKISKPTTLPPKNAVITTEKNGNTTVNIGSGNEVANESGTVDGKKWVNTKKVDGPKGDSDEAFWGKGGFWGNGKSAP